MSIRKTEFANDEFFHIFNREADGRTIFWGLMKITNLVAPPPSCFLVCSASLGEAGEANSHQRRVQTGGATVSLGQSANLEARPTSGGPVSKNFGVRATLRGSLDCQKVLKI